MRVFSAIRDAITVKKQTAQEKYLEIIGRVDNPLDGDSDLLPKLLVELGITLEQSEEDAKIIAEITALQTDADALVERQVAMDAAYRAVNAAGAEYAKVIAEWQGKLAKVENNKRSTAEAVRISSEAAKKISDLNRKLSYRFNSTKPKSMSITSIGSV